MGRPPVIRQARGALRLNRRTDEPFGGVQLAMFGDLWQLPPVVREARPSTMVVRGEGRPSKRLRREFALRVSTKHGGPGGATETLLIDRAFADPKPILAALIDKGCELRGTPEVEDVSVFPMAMPMIAGPGSIATIMLLTARAQGTEQTLVVLAAMGAVLVLTLVALIAAGPLMKLLGARVEAVITRLLGVLLAALAAQYVIDGIKAVLT